MKLHILYGQRKERYLGEYAPEVLAGIDEIGHSDNTAYLDGEKKKAIATNDFENVVVVTLEVDASKIMKMLRPQHSVICAEIVD